MPLYNSGETVRLGDVIGVEFVVTNIVPDSDRLNIVARTHRRHHGQPDDLRHNFSSSAVHLVKAAPAPEPEPVPEPAPEPAPVDPDPQTAEA